MGQFNPDNFVFYAKKGDLQLPLKIKLYDGDCSTPFDLTGYTGKFYMSDEDDFTDVKVNGVAVNITDAEEGEAEYRWVSGDTDTVGRYRYEFQFTYGTKSFRVPIYSPGIVVVVEKIG